MTTRVHPTLDELVRLRYDARGFSLLPRQPVASLLAGQHASRLRGRGLTFEELRDYRPGDDIRSMDWKATARLRKPHVRVYSEERERSVLLVVDQRITMFFGSDRTTKATAATEVAALAAWASIDKGDRVGALVFTDNEVIEVKPRRSRSNVMRICHELVEANRRLSADLPATNNATLNAAMQRAANLAHHDYLVLLVTDFHGNDETTRKHATYLAAHNDVLAVMVYDPLGIQIPANGRMEATDGNQPLTIPEHQQFSQRFEDAFRASVQEIRENLTSIRIPILPICTHDPVPEQIMAALGARR